MQIIIINRLFLKTPLSASATGTRHKAQGARSIRCRQRADIYPLKTPFDIVNLIG